MFLQFNLSCKNSTYNKKGLFETFLLRNQIYINIKYDAVFTIFIYNKKRIKCD